MRTFSAALLLSFLCYSNQQAASDPAFKQLIATSTTECLHEIGVDVSIIYKIWTDPQYPDNNHQLQCYYNCMNMKVGITDAAGKLNITLLMKKAALYADSDEVKEIGDKCDDVVFDSDLCEYSYHLTQCSAKIQLDDL